MVVKIIRRRQALLPGQPAERIFECQHISKTRVKDESDETVPWDDRPQIGWMVELGPSGPTLYLPQDGDELYAMNGEGNTVDMCRWPLKPPREEQVAEKEQVAS